MNIIDDDEVVAELVRSVNVNSPGVRRGSGHIKSAATSFGDSTCAACWRMQAHGGCETHRKKADFTKFAPPPAAPVPFKHTRSEREVVTEPRTAPRPTMTKTQKDVLRIVTEAHPAWYRSESNGQGITLASLYRAGLLERKLWQSKAGSAYEYRSVTPP